MNQRYHYALQRLLGKIKKDKDILAVFLFGSFVRRENNKESDMDICLVLNPGKFSARKISQIRMKYLSLFDLDIQIFQQLPIYVKQRILKEGKLLFCRQEDFLYEIAFQVIREFADFEPFYRDYLKEVLHARS